MRLTILPLLVAFAVSAKAASITATNIDFTLTNPVVNSTGTLYAVNSGYVAIGVFSSLSDSAIASLNSASSFEAAFTQFGTSSTFGSGFGIAGTYQFETTAGIPSGSTYSGPIYTVIGNAATLADSTQFLVFKENVNFNTDPGASGPAVLKNGSGTLIIGNYNTFTADIGAGNVGAFSTVSLVPEPSVTLLGVLGCLALLRRRRN